MRTLTILILLFALEGSALAQPPPLDLPACTALLADVQVKYTLLATTLPEIKTTTTETKVSLEQHRAEAQKVYKGGLKFVVERVLPVLGAALAAWQIKVHNDNPPPAPQPAVAPRVLLAFAR